MSPADSLPSSNISAEWLLDSTIFNDGLDWRSFSANLTLHSALSRQLADSCDDALVSNLQARPEIIDGQWCRGFCEQLYDRRQSVFLRI